MNFNNMSIGKKLFMAFSIIGILALTILIISWRGINAVQTNMDEIILGSKRVAEAHEMKSLVDLMRLNIWDIAVHREMSGRLAGKNEMERTRAAIKEKTDFLMLTVKTETGRELFAKINQSVADAHDLNNKAIDLFLAGNSGKARVISEEAMREAQAISGLMQKLGQEAREIIRRFRIDSGMQSKGPFEKRNFKRTQTG
jgi:CHASE3 domain sensor protein